MQNYTEYKKIQQSVYRLITEHSKLRQQVVNHLSER